LAFFGQLYCYIRGEKLEMKKLFVLVAAIGILSSCASSVRNDVNRYEHEILISQKNISRLESKIVRQNSNIKIYRSRISELNNSIRNNKANIYRARGEITRSKSYLSANSDVFLNGQCVRPHLDPKPRPYCESRSEAKEYALAYCSMSAGCDAAMLLASDELDTFSKRFLASEACARAVHKLSNEGYSPDSTAVNALEALSETGCSNEGSGFFSFLGKVGGCLMSASIKLSKIQSYVNCTERKAESCYSSYIDWKEKPVKRQRECLTNMANIATYTSGIPKYKQKIEASRNAIQKNKRRIQITSNLIAISTKSLEKERERNARYSRLLAARKKTIAYKLYGK
jgi:peptidoglycan hydrolase CwlO-like protein